MLVRGARFVWLGALCLNASLLSIGVAHAAVVEPNGNQVPKLNTGNGEVTLQEYFDAQKEPIDALAEASATPGVFSPLCDFTAKLVLAEAGSAAGLAWYNVPADPHAKPDQLFPLVAESATTVGQTINAADIRASADYKGGFIGFALMESGAPAYYSEYERNANCTKCSQPGYWKMMLAYRSSVHQSSYYLCFEDWPGANDSSWGSNDGDFQDKVFLITGVSCPGGGEICDTGKPGACGAGLTECSFSGTPVCKQQTSEAPEKCDNVDNDCNGLVDDGELCPPTQVCVRGQCVGACNTGEFKCPSGLVCGADGYCIESACKDVTCGKGLACRGGKCVGACEGVSCPLGQVCILDRCVDPCAGVTCASGTYCERGVCVGDCTCSGCTDGKRCAADGRCVEAQCENVKCPAGQGCRAGACVDACEGVVCPGGALCSAGVCADPPPAAGGASSTGGEASAAGGFLINLGGASSASGGFSVTAGGASAQAGGTSAQGGSTPFGESSKSSSGCGCQLPGATTRSAAALSAVFGLLLLSLRARRRRSPRAR